MDHERLDAAPARVPLQELESRMLRFRSRMDTDHPDWALAAIFGRINLYYFTGTMQDGVLVIPREDEATYWVRRSFERAQEESAFARIRPMSSYRDAASPYQGIPPVLFSETEVVPLAVFERFRKYFRVQEIRSLDLQALRVRAVKSPFELALIQQAGQIHRQVLEDEVPGILKEGMSEADLATQVYSRMVELGHDGIVRFGGFNIEIEVGLIDFGDHSICPNSFNGPAGCRGIGAAAPVLGSRTRKLRDGDLVYIDNACSVGGYHSDKTIQYVFGAPLPEEAVRIHRDCVEIQKRVAGRLRPGITPSAIYTEIMEDMPREFQSNFMGFGSRRVHFLGHGVGLAVDEIPVLARGFDDPLEEGMTIAVEPKKGIAGIGMVGTENTYLVTPEGGRSITGSSPGLLPVPLR